MIFFKNIIDNLVEFICRIFYSFSSIIYMLFVFSLVLSIILALYNFDIVRGFSIAISEKGNIEGFWRFLVLIFALFLSYLPLILISMFTTSTFWLLSLLWIIYPNKIEKLWTETHNNINSNLSFIYDDLSIGVSLTIMVFFSLIFILTVFYSVYKNIKGEKIWFQKFFDF